MIKKLISLFAIAVILCTGLSVAAEESSFKLSGSKAAAGQDFEVTLTATSADVASIAGTIVFDTKVLEFKEADLDISGWDLETNQTDNKLLFAAANTKKANTTDKNSDVITFTFTAKSDATGKNAVISAEGVSVSSGKGAVSGKNASYSVKVLETLNAGSDDNDNNATDNSGNYGTNLGGTTAEGLSNNNRLASLTVNGVTLTPEFEPEVKTYEATVPYEVQKLEIEAVAADEKATVTIKDDELPYIGTNITRIQVVSESGLQRTYKIYTTRTEPTAEVKTEPVQDGMNTAAIIFIIAGAVLAVAVILVIVLVIVKKKKISK